MKVSVGARVLLACSVFILTNWAYGQATPTAAEILEEVRSTYANMAQYKWSATISEEVKNAAGKSDVATTSVSVAVQKPDRLRWEVKGSGASAYTGMYGGEEVIVSNGKEVFWYSPRLKQYTKTPIGPLVTPMGTVLAFINSIEDTFFYGFKVADPIGAKLLKMETLSSGDSSVSCYVVEIATPLQSTFTWWVDAQRNIVVREVFENMASGRYPYLTRRTNFSFAQIGNAPESQSFEFSPPPGVRLRKAFEQVP
jgi:outer membrane lipoprotein-sorting protein